jgi:hypothetical protein
MSFVQFLSAWKSSRVLDDRKVGKANRDQALVHALLREQSAAPMEKSPDGLRRAIAMRIEATQPLPAKSAWSISRGLIATAVPVAALTIGGAMLLQTRVASTPTVLQPVVSRPFSPIVAVRQDESGVTAGFPQGSVDEGLLTNGPMVSARRPVPRWMRELPGAPADRTRTVLASDALSAGRADPLLMEARQFEFTTRMTAQTLIMNQLANQQERKREE